MVMLSQMNWGVQIGAGLTAHKCGSSWFHFLSGRSSVCRPHAFRSTNFNGESCRKRRNGLCNLR